MAPCSYSAPSCGRLHPRWWWAVGELPANDGHCGPVVLSKDLRRWCHIHKVVDQWPPPGVLPALPNYECHPKNAFYATYASPHGSVSWTSTLLVPACCVKLFLFPRFGPLVRHWTMRFEAKHSYFKQLAQAMGNFYQPALLTGHEAPASTLLSGQQCDGNTWGWIDCWTRYYLAIIKT